MLIWNRLTNENALFLWILLLNMLNSNMEKLKKHDFKKKFAGNFVFLETKKVDGLRC